MTSINAIAKQMVFSTEWRLSEGSFDAPAESVNPVAYEATINSGLAGPFSGTHGFPVERDCSSFAGVSHLLSLGCPSAVFRAVVAVVVDAVNAATRWSFAHVGKEVVENTPAVTYRDSAAAVPIKVFAGWDGATLNHSLPNRVFSGCLVTASMSVFVAWAFCSTHLANKAAARTCDAFPEIASVNDGLITAIATAQPRRVPPFLLAGWGHGHKTTKPITGAYDASHRSPSSSRVSQKMLGRAVTETAFSGATLAEPSILAHVSQGVPSRG